MAEKLALIFVGIVVGCGANVVCAKDHNGNFAVKGVGVLNCEAYIEAAEAGDRELAQYAGYLTGYVSAFNEVHPDTFDLLPWQHVDTVMLLMLQRCRRAPQNNFGSAVSEMMLFFDQHKLASLANRIRVGSSDNGTEFYEPVVADIKAALESWGYPTLDLSASLRQFQRDQQLTMEDDFGQKTLLKLLYGRKTD